MDSLRKSDYSGRMFWRAYQMAVMIAVGGFLMSVSGEDASPIIVGITSVGAAYAATVGLQWLLSRRRDARSE